MRTINQAIMVATVPTTKDQRPAATAIKVTVIKDTVHPGKLHKDLGEMFEQSFVFLPATRLVIISA